MNTVLVAIHICWYKSQYEVTLMPNCFHKTVHRYPFCMSGCVEFHIFFLVEECWWNVFEKSRFCLKWRNFRYAVLWKRFEMFFSTRFSNFVPVTFRFWHQADFFLVQQNGFFSKIQRGPTSVQYWYFENSRANFHVMFLLNPTKPFWENGHLLI